MPTARDVFKLMATKYKKHDFVVFASFFEIYSGKVGDFTIIVMIHLELSCGFKLTIFIHPIEHVERAVRPELAIRRLLADRRGGERGPT